MDEYAPLRSCQTPSRNASPAPRISRRPSESSPRKASNMCCRAGSICSASRRRSRCRSASSMRSATARDRNLRCIPYRWFRARPCRSRSDPVADLSSLIICPWDKTIAWVFADLFFQGKPYSVCPRLALKRQVQLALDKGLRPMAGIEPEFIVMRFDANGRPVKAFDTDPRRQALSGRGARPGL